MSTARELHFFGRQCLWASSSDGWSLAPLCGYPVLELRSELASFGRLQLDIPRGNDFDRMLADTARKLEKPKSWVATQYAFCLLKARRLAVCVGENEHSVQLRSIENANKKAH